MQPTLTRLSIPGSRGVQNKFTWEELVTRLCKIFGERNRVDTIEEFNKLRQTGSVEVYLKRFEALYDSTKPTPY